MECQYAEAESSGEDCIRPGIFQDKMEKRLREDEYLDYFVNTANEFIGARVEPERRFEEELCREFEFQDEDFLISGYLSLENLFLRFPEFGERIYMFISREVERRNEAILNNLRGFFFHTNYEGYRKGVLHHSEKEKNVKYHVLRFVDFFAKRGSPALVRIQQEYYASLTLAINWRSHLKSKIPRGVSELELQPYIFDPEQKGGGEERGETEDIILKSMVSGHLGRQRKEWLRDLLYDGLSSVVYKRIISHSLLLTGREVVPLLIEIMEECPRAEIQGEIGNILAMIGEEEAIPALQRLGRTQNVSAIKQRNRVVQPSEAIKEYPLVKELYREFGFGIGVSYDVHEAIMFKAVQVRKQFDLMEKEYGVKIIQAGDKAVLVLTQTGLLAYGFGGDLVDIYSGDVRKEMEIPLEKIGADIKYIRDLLEANKDMGQSIGAVRDDSVVVRKNMINMTLHHIPFSPMNLAGIRVLQDRLPDWKWRRIRKMKPHDKDYNPIDISLLTESQKKHTRKKRWRVTEFVRNKILSAYNKRNQDRLKREGEAFTWGKDSIALHLALTPANAEVFIRQAAERFEGLRVVWCRTKIEEIQNRFSVNISSLPLAIQVQFLAYLDFDPHSHIPYNLGPLEVLRSIEDDDQRLNFLISFLSLEQGGEKMGELIIELVKAEGAGLIFQAYADVALLVGQMSEQIQTKYQEVFPEASKSREEIEAQLLDRAREMLLRASEVMNSGTEEGKEGLEWLERKIRQEGEAIERGMEFVLELQERINEISQRDEAEESQEETAKLKALMEKMLRGEAPVLPEGFLGIVLSAYDEFVSPTESVGVLEGKLEELNAKQREAFGTLKKGKDYGARRKAIKNHYHKKREALGYELHRQKNPTPVQIPIGIGHDPKKERQVQQKSIGLLRVLFDSERRAQKDGGKRRIVVYDTPQVTNYLNFTRSMGDESPREYIERLVRERGGTVEAVSYAVAEAIGEQEKIYFERLIQGYDLKHVEVVSFCEIEQSPLFQELLEVVRTMINEDQGLQKALLKTVDDRFLKKAGIGIKGKEDSQNKEEIRAQLAEYAVKVITLHIWNRGDTVVHEAEKKNYQITQGLLGLRRGGGAKEENLNALLEILKKDDPEVDIEVLKQIRFPHLKSFQGVSLDDNEAPEEYKAHGAGEEVFLRANQVLLSGDKLSWLKFITDEHGKREEFVQEVVVPLLVGHYYYTHGPEGGREQLRKALGKVVGWSDVCDLVSGTIGETLGVAKAAG